MSDRKRARLLIVDDDKDFADFVVRVADELGYAATAATSVRAFKEAFLADTPDLIVLDILMPEQDGIETIQWLVSNGCNARIIICSGYDPLFAHAAKVIGEHQGGLRITQIAKPIRLADLRAHLSEGRDPV